MRRVGACEERDEKEAMLLATRRYLDSFLGAKGE
jgi:hypothetical protein